MQVTDPAIDNQLAGLMKLAAGPLLGAGLEDPAVAFDLVGKRAAFSNRECQRLFAIDVLTRSNRGDRGGDVSMVRRSDGNRVDIVPRDYIAKIVIARSLAETDRCSRLFSVGGVDVANGYDLRGGIALKVIHVAAALAPDTDAADGDAVARRVSAENG